VNEWLKISPADASARPDPGFSDRPRDGLPQFNSAVTRQSAELVFVREFVRRPRAIEETDLGVWNRQGVVKHRAKGRDAGSACDEDESPLGRRGRKGERSAWTVNIHQTARLERQVGSRFAVGVDADEQLQVVFAECFLGRDGERIWPLRTASCADHDGLAGSVIEFRASELEPDDARARCGRKNFPDGQREKHGGLC